MLKELLDRVFGETLPPASADGDDGGWGRKEHNRHLGATLSGSQAEVIRMSDITTKKRYEAMDSHIDQLKGMAAESRRRKEHRRTLREAAELIAAGAETAS